MSKTKHSKINRHQLLLKIPSTAVGQCVASGVSLSLSLSVSLSLSLSLSLPPSLIVSDKSVDKGRKHEDAPSF